MQLPSQSRQMGQLGKLSLAIQDTQQVNGTPNTVNYLTLGHDEKYYALNIIATEF